MRLFVANVGVNTADASRHGLRSPVFPDGTFEFVPITERPAIAGTVPTPTYVELPSWTGRALSLASFLPSQMRSSCVHSDPDFETLTYGDIWTGRAANLKRIVSGDELWFVSRLWNHDGHRFIGGAGAYFVGYLSVEAIVQVERGMRVGDLSDGVRERIARNAHYRWLEAGLQEDYLVLVGDRSTSCRFLRALPASPEIVAHVYGGDWGPFSGAYTRDGEVLRNKNGRPRSFGTFGSVTRTIQPFLDSGEGFGRAHIAKLHEAAAHCGRADPP